MAYTMRDPESRECIDLRRLWWAGPLTVTAALGANAVVRTVAVAVFAISPAFHNLAWVHFTWVTAAAVSTAALVFAVVVRYADRPVRRYRQIAAVALVLSFIPNLGLVVGDVLGGSPAAIATLMVMHVVDAAICASLLPSLTSTSEPRSEDIREPREATASRR